MIIFSLGNFELSKSFCRMPWWKPSLPASVQTGQPCMIRLLLDSFKQSHMPDLYCSNATAGYRQHAFKMHHANALSWLRWQESFWCSSTWRAMARLIRMHTSSARKLPDTWPQMGKGSSRMAVVILLELLASWVSSRFVARILHWHVVRVAFFIEQSRSMQLKWTPMWTIISGVNAGVCV